MFKVDLRSDTLTQPTAAMKEAMFAAPVGDDVFGDDPSVNALEQQAATLFGMEAALFCTSGTLTNQLAIRVHTTPGGEVICDALSHVYLYEGGGIALNSLASVQLIAGNKGRITAAQVAEAVNPTHDVHRPLSQLVVVENTMNKGGGSIYEFEELQKIKAVCQQHGLAFHLDGARLFNALVETNETPLQYGQLFDSISICLSKGLGCPVGSLLLGKKDFIQQARRYRKVMGGGWRQAGFLAAAGSYALKNHVQRLSDDHRRAKILGEILASCPFVQSVYPIQTNIVIFEVIPSLTAQQVVEALQQQGVGCVVFGKQLVRFVTHLNITDDHIAWLSEHLPQWQLN